MTTKVFLQMILAATMLVAGCQTLDLSPSMTNSDKCTASFSSSTKVTSTHISAYLNGYKGVSETRSAEIAIDPLLNGTDTVMYLVNYPQGGWEVLSADIRAPKVLVMSKGGCMTVENLTSNPAVESLYGSMGDYISFLHKNPEIDVETAGDWEDVVYQIENAQTREIESWVLIGTTVLEDIEEEQDHLTITRWGQGSPSPSVGKWNYYSPRLNPSSQYRCYTGCIPVAIAQMMYYLHYKIGHPVAYYNDFTVSTSIPTGATSVKIATSHLTGTGSLGYDWSILPLKHDASYTEEQYKYVSSIMTHIGYCTDATYSSTGTSVLPSKIKPFFSSLGISCSGPSDTDWNIITGEIFDRNMPVMLGVYTANDEGHRVILDGLYSRLRRVEKRYVWNSISGPQYKTEIELDTQDLVCFNWGYEDSGMVSSSGDTIWYNVYATAWSAGGYDFIETDNMIYGFNY